MITYRVYTTQIRVKQLVPNLLYEHALMTVHTHTVVSERGHIHARPVHTHLVMTRHNVTMEGDMR